MYRLNDWVVEPKFFKEYLNWRGEFAARAALETRSVSEHGAAHMRMFSAFAWKI